MKENLSNVENKNVENKQEKLKYDAIVIFGGELIKKGEENKKKYGNNEYRSTNYSDEAVYGALGDRVRIIAGDYLFRDGKGKYVLAVGGKPKCPENESSDMPARSEVIKDELINRGVPEENIFADVISQNTKQNIEEILKISIKKGWKKLLLISNRYHIPRISAFINEIKNTNDEFKKIEIDFQDAEEVLEKHNKHWIPLIKKAYASEEMERRKINEQKGLKALRSGEYNSDQDKK